MSKVKLLCNGSELSLWEFAGQAMQDEVSSTVLINEQVKKGKLMTLCETLTGCEIFINQIFEELDWKGSLKRYISLKIFGSFEQLRTEMELRYPKAEIVFLKSKDHKTIHGYWIPFNQSDDVQTPNAPTMLVCGPNAEQAEMIQYNTDLLEFYLGNGINVMVFNYRGYGLSEGTPSIRKIKQDAETVVQFIRQKVGQHAKVGVHGRSIGGLVASHLARKGLVNFLFADRTFTALDEVAAQMLGEWARYGLRFFTMWLNTDVTTDYIFSSCYKVMGVASNDEIIADAASLKTGVAKKIVSLSP